MFQVTELIINDFYYDTLFVPKGGTLQGFISDVLQKRAPVLALSLFLAIGALVGYSREYSLAITCPDLLGLRHLS